MPFLSDDLRKLFAVLEYSKDWKNSKAAESNQKNSDISHISRGCDDVTWSNGTTNLPTTIWTKEAPTTLQQDHLEWSRQSRTWAHHQQNMCVISHRRITVFASEPQMETHVWGGCDWRNAGWAGLGCLKAAIGFELKFIVSTKCTLGDQLRSIIDFHTSW